MTLLLPSDTKEIPLSGCCNLGLRFFRVGVKEEHLGDEKNKKNFLREVAQAANGWKRDKTLIGALESLKRRGEAALRAFPLPCRKILEAKTQWRLIVGLGADSPLEVGMTLHRIHGIPYIPGSAVKGLTRYSALLEVQEKCGETFKELESRIFGDQAPESEDELMIRNAFGAQKLKGKVAFLDAYPNVFPTLELDIMNPHYGDYYSGKKRFPADWMNPIPVYFLTVAPDTGFTFLIAAETQELLEKAEFWLTQALSGLGIGAKTRVGYGGMDVLSGIADAKPPGGPKAVHSAVAPPGRASQTARDLLDLAAKLTQKDKGRVLELIKHAQSLDQESRRVLADALMEKARQWKDKDFKKTLRAAFPECFGG